MPVMPGDIVEAVTQVTENAKSLVRDKDNNFAGYKFVSHDQIKDKVGKLMAAAGITLVCDEVSADVADKYLKCHYEIWIYHKSGSSYGPIHRRVMVSANGPQAFGIAASYVQKYFLRDLFQIPTGEKETDLEPDIELPDTNKVKVDVEKLYEEMKTDLEACESLQDIDDWADLYRPQKSLLRKAQQVSVTKLFTEKKESFKQPEQEKVDG